MFSLFTYCRRFAGKLIAWFGLYLPSWGKLVKMGEKSPSSSEEKPAHEPEMHVEGDAESTTLDALAGGERKQEKISKELEELIQCRQTDIGAEEDGSLSQSCRIVDFLNELRMMEPSYSPDEKRYTARLFSELQARLRKNGGEIVDEDEWNPFRQRAVEREYGTVSSDKTIIREKISFGLVVRHRLIRKQEVRILSPKP